MKGREYGGGCGECVAEAKEGMGGFDGCWFACCESESVQGHRHDVNDQPITKGSKSQVCVIDICKGL